MTGDDIKDGKQSDVDGRDDIFMMRWPSTTYQYRLNLKNGRIQLCLQSSLFYDDKDQEEIILQLGVEAAGKLISDLTDAITETHKAAVEGLIKARDEAQTMIQDLNQIYGNAIREATPAIKEEMEKNVNRLMTEELRQYRSSSYQASMRFWGDGPLQYARGMEDYKPTDEADHEEEKVMRQYLLMSYYDTGPDTEAGQ